MLYGTTSLFILEMISALSLGVFASFSSFSLSACQRHNTHTYICIARANLHLVQTKLLHEPLQLLLDLFQVRTAYSKPISAKEVDEEGPKPEPRHPGSGDRCRSRPRASPSGT